MNLFLATRRLTDAKENHLTEFLAAALETDRAFRTAYAAVLLRPFRNGRGRAEPEIKSVETQRAFPGTGCCPDLVLSLAGGQVILCEHKIEAPETLGVDGEDEAAVRQLERYLRLPVDGVAYFRSTWKPPSADVLTNPKYIRPTKSEHFLWRDLYAPLQHGTTDITRWLLEGFEALGYTPAHPRIGDLADPDHEVRSANKRNFAKLWQKTRSSVRELGWKVDTGSVCELYLRRCKNAIAREIYVTPGREGGRILLVRVTPEHENYFARVKGRLESAAESLHPAPRIESMHVPRARGRVNVVDVEVPLVRLLDGVTTSVEIEDGLCSFVLPLVQAVSPKASTTRPDI